MNDAFCLSCGVETTERYCPQCVSLRRGHNPAKPKMYVKRNGQRKRVPVRESAWWPVLNEVRSR